MEEMISLALPLVKARRNRLVTDTSMDGYLTSRITGVIQQMAKIGITLDAASTDDLLLLVDWTVWEYSNRDKAGGVPEWLRLRRRERWLNKRGGDNDS